MPYSSAYWPPRATRSAWLPTSTSRAPSRTTIRSAMRTVENRCDTSRGMPPPARAAAAWRPKRGGRAGVALEQGVLGLGVQGGGGLVQDQQQRLVAHEPAGQGQLLPLAKGHL